MRQHIRLAAVTQVEPSGAAEPWTRAATGRVRNALEDLLQGRLRRCTRIRPVAPIGYLHSFGMNGGLAGTCFPAGGSSSGD
jgi:hypothetical protein